MSVVKKYYNGGSYYGDDLEAFLDKKTEEAKFTAPGLTSKEDRERYKQALKAAARQWADLAKDSKFDEVYKHDRLKDIYSIDVAKLPANFSSNNWTGVDKPVTINRLGQFVVDKDNPNSSINSIIATWINEYKATKPKPIKTQRNVANITESLIANDYGTEEMFERDWYKQDLNTRQAKILERAKKDIDFYENLQQTTPGDEFLNLDKIEAVKEAMASGDFTNFQEAARGLKWDIGALMEPQEVGATEEELLAAKIEAFKKRGISDPNLIQSLIDGNWAISDDFDPYGTGWFPKYMEKQKAFVIKDPYGNVKVIKNSDIFNEKFLNPTSRETYGHSWQHDPTTGNARFTSPLDEDFDRTDFASPTEYGGYRILDATLPQQYWGWNATGYNTTDSKDILGFPDFTKHIVLRGKEGTEPIELIWGDSGYQTLDGTPFPGVNIQKYGNYNSWDINSILNNTEDAFTAIQPANNFTTVEEAVEAFDQYKSKIGKNKPEGAVVINKVIADLRYKMQTSKSIVEREKAFSAYRRILEEIETQGKSTTPELIINPPVKETPAIQQLIKNLYNRDSSGFRQPTFSKGGILKASEGARLSTEEFLAKYKVKETTTKENKLRDRSGTLADADAWDIASLVTTGASMIPLPGVGAFGGAALTAIDIARDIREDDGKINWGTHLGNVAFTGLGLVGLGGLRALKVAAKGAKALDTALDVSKASKNIARLTKAGGISPEVSNAVKGVEAASRRINSSNFDEYLKKLKSVSSKNLSQVEKKVLEDFGMTVRKNGSIQIGSKTLSRTQAAKKIEDARDLTLGVQILDTRALAPELAAIGQAGKWLITNPVTKNALRYGAPLGIGAMGVGAVGNVISDWKEDGVGAINLNDAKSILLMSSLGAQTLTNLRNAKAVTKFTKPATTTKDSFSLAIGDKNIPLSKEVTIPKLSKLDKFRNKEFDEKTLTKFKKELEEAGVESAEDIITLLKEEGKASIIKTKGSTSGLELDFSKENILANPSQYIRATKVIKRGLRPIGAPRPNTTRAQELRDKFDAISKKVQTSTTEQQIQSLRNEQSKIMQELAGLPYMQSGGVMKFQTPATPLGTSKGWSPMKPYTDEVIKRYFLNNPKPNKAETSKEWSPMKPYTDEVIKRYFLNKDTLPKVTPQTEIIPKLTGIQSLAEASKENIVVPTLAKVPTLETSMSLGNTGFNKKDFPEWLKNSARYINPTLVANTVGLLATYAGNKKIANLQRKAIVDGIFRPDFMGRRTYTVSSDIDLPYLQKAQDLRAKSSRIASASANLNPAVQLEGERMASQIELEGALRKSGDIRQMRSQQEQSDDQVDRVNLDLMNRYKGSIAEAQGKLPLVEAQKRLYNQANLNRFMVEAAENLRIQDMKLARKDLLNLPNDPEYNSYLDESNALTEQLGKARENWDNSPTRLTYVNQDFEFSPEYANISAKLKALAEQYKPYTQKVNNLKFRAGYIKKGGSLQEKIVLENVKQSHKKELAYIKSLDKKHSEINKLLIASLIKIFK